MNKGILSAVCVVSLLASGCVMRTYPLTKDRIDQDLASGNRGYLAGNVPSGSEERKSTRTTQVVEIEIGSPFKFGKKCAPQSQQVSASQTEGNQGYVSSSNQADMSESAKDSESYTEYTVEKNDTLQKISKKFYGTTKRWKKIFDANQEKLKSPDKVFAGQVLRIPESSKPAQPDLK